MVAGPLVVAGLAADPGQQAVGAQEAGGELEAVGERGFGPRPVLHGYQRGTQQEVAHRVAIMQADGFQRAFGGLVGAPSVQVDAGKLEVGLGVVGIGLQHPVGRLFGLGPLPEGGVAAGEHQLGLHLAGGLFFDLLEQGQGVGEIFPLDGDGGFDQLRFLGATEGFQGLVDGCLGLLEQAEADLALGQHLGEVGAGGLGVVAAFQKREGLLEPLGVHQRAGHVPVVFAAGFYLRLFRILGDLVDVAEGDELVEQGAVGFGIGVGAIAGGQVASFPGRDHLHESVFGQTFGEDAALHVGADG